MSLLMYDIDGSPNSLRNGSFEKEFPIYADEGDDWFATTTNGSFATVARQNETRAFGSWAAKMQTFPSLEDQVCTLNQIITIQNFSASNIWTMSCLLLGKSQNWSQSLRLTIQIEELIEDEWRHRKTYDREVRAVDDQSWNIFHTTFKIPQILIGSTIRLLVSFILGGPAGTSGLYYLDNAKVEPGSRPTRYSDENGEFSEAPAVFNTFPGIDFSGLPQSAIDNVPRDSARPSGGGSFNAGRANKGVVQGGQEEKSGSDKCMEEWEEFMQEEKRERLEKKRDRVRNKEPQKWEKSEDLEHLKCKRCFLRDCIKTFREEGQTIGVLRWLLHQMSGRRRDYEQRYQNDLDARAHNVNDANMLAEIVDAVAERAKAVMNPG